MPRTRSRISLSAALASSWAATTSSRPASGSVSSFSLAAPEVGRQRDEALLGPVVEVALDPPPLRLGAVDGRGAARLAAAPPGRRARRRRSGPSRARASTTLRRPQPDRDPRRHDHEAERADAGASPRAGSRRDLEEVELGRVAGQGVDVGGQPEHRRRPAQAAVVNANVSAATGKWTRWKAISRQRAPERTRSRRRPNHDVAVNGRHRVADAHPGHRRDTRSLDLAEPTGHHEQHPGERQRQHERDQQSGRRREERDHERERDRRRHESGDVVGDHRARGAPGGATAGTGCRASRPSGSSPQVAVAGVSRRRSP